MILTCRCGNPFTPKRPWQKHCSAPCRKAAYLEGQGEVVSVRQGKTSWSVVLHFDQKPAIETGSLVTVMRSGRISEPVLCVDTKEPA